MGCGLQQKKGVHSQVCYKVYAIHMTSQHGVMEKVMEADARPEPQALLRRIRAFEKGEVEEEEEKKEAAPVAKVVNAWDAALSQDIIFSTEENVDDPLGLPDLEKAAVFSRVVDKREEKVVEKTVVEESVA